MTSHHPKPGERSGEEIQAAAARWFAALDRSVMTVEERCAYEQWRLDPENHAALLELEYIWKELGSAHARLDLKGEIACNQVNVSTRVYPTQILAAGAVALCATFSGFILTNGPWWTVLDWWSR